MDNMITASAVLVPMVVLLLLFIIPIAFWFYGNLKKGTSAYANCIDLDKGEVPLESKKEIAVAPSPKGEKKSSSSGTFTSKSPASSSAYAVKTDPVDDYPLVMLGHQLLVNSQESAPSYAYDAACDLLNEEISSSRSSSYEPPASSHSSWSSDTLHSSHTPSWHSSSSSHSSSYSDHGSSPSSSDSGSSSSYDSGSSSSWD